MTYFRVFDVHVLAILVVWKHQMRRTLTSPMYVLALRI